MNSLEMIEKIEEKQQIIKEYCANISLILDSFPDPSEEILEDLRNYRKILRELEEVKEKWIIRSREHLTLQSDNKM